MSKKVIRLTEGQLKQIIENQISEMGFFSNFKKPSKQEEPTYQPEEIKKSKNYIAKTFEDDEWGIARINHSNTAHPFIPLSSAEPHPQGGYIFYYNCKNESKKIKAPTIERILQFFEDELKKEIERGFEYDEELKENIRY